MKPIDVKDIKGYVGKLLWVDMDTHTTKTLPTYDYIDGVGGMFMSAYINWKHGKRGIKNGRDPESLLMFLTGPLTGSPISGGARSTVCFQQIVQEPSLWAQSSVAGGGFGPELKFAGYDGIIVRGKSEKPVYLWINDGNVEFRDASSWYYEDTYQAHDRIIRELGGDKRIRTAIIGPAGANCNAMSAIIFDTSHAAAQHPGGVMGCKNLKAIAVRGHGAIPIADPEMVRKIRNAHYYISDVKGWETVGTRGERLISSYSMYGPSLKRVYNCYGCFSCRMPYMDIPEYPKGGQNCGFHLEYCTAMGVGHLKKLKYRQNAYGDGFVDPPRYSLLGSHGKYLISVPKLLDKYGISGYELMGMRTPLNLLNVLCFSDKIQGDFRGWLEKEVGAEYGSMDFVRSYTYKIAHREGEVGPWMADGLQKAAEELRDNPEKFGLTKEDGKYAWEAYERCYPIHGSFEHHFYRPTNADPRDNPETIRISPVSCGIYGLGSRQMGKSSHCATEIYDESQRNSRAMAYAAYGDERAACRYLDENDEPVLFKQPYMDDENQFYTLDGKPSKPVKPNFTKGSPLAILRGAAFSYYNDVLGTCDWVWPMLYGNTNSILFAAGIPKNKSMVQWAESPEKVSHPEWSPMSVTAVTGIEKTLDDFYYDAFRAMTVERAIQVMDSNRMREDDMPNLQTVNRPDSNGIIIGYDNMNEWKKGMAIVYEMLGWDPETGVPTRKGLHKYGLDDLADEMAAMGKLSLSLNSSSCANSSSNSSRFFSTPSRPRLRITW